MMEHTNMPMKQVSQIITSNISKRQTEKLKIKKKKKKKKPIKSTNGMKTFGIDEIYFVSIGNGIKAEEQGFLKNAGVPDQETQVIDSIWNK